MFRRLLISIALLLDGLFCLAQAQVPLTGAGESLVVSCINYTGPGDIVSGATAWWGLRAYSCKLANAGATTTPVMDVYGVTTTTSCTIYLLGNGTGGLDFSTAGSGGTGNQCLLGATTFCSVTNTSCTISKLYDQTGNNYHVTQSNTSRPTLVFSQFGSLPAIQGGTGIKPLVNASFTSTSQPYTFSMVADCTQQYSQVSVVASTYTGGSGGQAGFDNSSNANKFRLYAGSTADASITLSALHSIQAVFSSSSSSVDVDGTTTSSLNPGTGAQQGEIGLLGDPIGSSILEYGYVTEVGVWPTGLSGTLQGYLCHNQHTYWGTSTSC